MVFDLSIPLFCQLICTHHRTVAIYNTEWAGFYPVDYDDCLTAMEAPLGDHVSKRDSLVTLTKRDNCWGEKHNDYKGGYYKIDGIGAFGSEVYAFQ